MKTKIYFLLFFSCLMASFFAMPGIHSVRAAAIVKGEVPKVQPLQSLPPSTKPNYEKNIQSGEFEAGAKTQEEQVSDEAQAPVPAPTVRSSMGFRLWYVIIFIMVATVVGYFLWQRIKRKL